MDIWNHILRFRKKWGNKNKTKLSSMIGFILALFVSLIAASMIVLGINRYAEISGNLPSPVILETLLEEPAGSLLQPTTVYDRSGRTILWQFESPMIDSRRYVHITDGNTLFFSELPEEAVTATIIAIDPEYLSRPEHFIENIIYNHPDPIPRTLAEELLLWQESEHPFQQIRINLLGDQIVGKYGRLKILEWYLNSAYYGNQIYGIHQAARVYFDKEPKSLNTAESTLLAAVALQPSLNPYDAPTAARETQKMILDEMVSADKLSQESANQAAKQDLIYADPDSSLPPQPPAFVSYLLGEVSAVVPLDRLLRGGFKIVSTLNSDLQSAANCSSEIYIDRTYGAESLLDEACPATRFLPKYDGEILADNSSLEIQLVLLDPVTGELLAMTEASRGGDHGSIFDYKPAGTLITPFIYLNAFTQGFEPASLVWDIPIPENDLSVRENHPGCGENCEFEGPVNIRAAMAKDFISPALQQWKSAGSQRIVNTLTLFGFTLPGVDCDACLPFPGSPQLNMIDFAQAYGIFANQGTLSGRSRDERDLNIRPKSILLVEDISNSRAIELFPSIEKIVIGDQLTYLVNDVLKDENARAGITHSSLYQIGRPAGVKRGFVPQSSSAWVVGYSPQLVAVVWSSALSEEGETLDFDLDEVTASIWRSVIQYGSQDLELADWDLPPGMVTLEVCYPSGQLPNENCPRVVREPFIEGNEPQEEDSLFQVLEVNRETGLLASVFTPPQQIEERVYLTLPEIAANWAKEAGIPTPPELYDLETTPSDDQGLSISAPDNFAFLSGKVIVEGSLPEEDFNTARLQYGSGMNPRSWLQIGQDITTPGKDIALGVWDTTNLQDGIYALQLVKIGERQEIEKSSLVISVDNTPPEIGLVKDVQDQDIPYQGGKELVLQADFENQSEIQEVRFFLDSKLEASRESPPFVYAWPRVLGEHNLRIIAEDQAGNQAELRITFRVVQP